MAAGGGRQLNGGAWLGRTEERLRGPGVRAGVASRLWDVSLEYLGPVPDGEWRALLSAQLGRADEFRVHMPDGEGPLSYGRAQFMALAGVEVRPWDGMRDAVELVGPVTPEAAELFLRLEPSIESFDPEHKLWDYALVRNERVILSVGDYHDLQVDLPD